MTSHFDHVHHYNYFSLSAKDKAELMETVKQSHPIEPVIKDKFEPLVSWGKITASTSWSKLIGEHKHYAIGGQQLSYHHSVGKSINLDFNAKELYYSNPIDYVPVNADLHKIATTAQSLSIATMGLPGMNVFISQCPAYASNLVLDNFWSCPQEATLRYMLIHLNDVHEWTREQIADWLETIHDPTGENGPNLNFQVEEMANG